MFTCNIGNSNDSLRKEICDYLNNFFGKIKIQYNGKYFSYIIAQNWRMIPGKLKEPQTNLEILRYIFEINFENKEQEILFVLSYHISFEKKIKFIN